MQHDGVVGLQSAEFADARGYADVMQTRAVQDLKRGGLERSLQEVAQTFERVRTDSSGWLDVLRDVIGQDLIGVWLDK